MWIAQSRSFIHCKRTPPSSNIAVNCDAYPSRLLVILLVLIGNVVDDIIGVDHFHVLLGTHCNRLARVHTQWYSLRIHACHAQRYCILSVALILYRERVGVVGLNTFHEVIDDALLRILRILLPVDLMKHFYS